MAASVSILPRKIAAKPKLSFPLVQLLINSISYWEGDYISQKCDNKFMPLNV